MGRARLRLAVAALYAVAASGCASVAPATIEHAAVYGPASIALRLIGIRRLDHRLQFGATTVGGLSGLDYDARRDRYYVISDDKSEFAPTRFYVVRLALDADGFHDVALQSVVTLLAPDGGPYPSRARGGSADAESIRYDPSTDTVWWSSEGERRLSRSGSGS